MSTSEVRKRQAKAREIVRKAAGRTEQERLAGKTPADRKRARAKERCAPETVRIEVHNEIDLEDTVRLNRTRSMFNVETVAGQRFDLDLELPLPAGWRIGVVVGPSGSGKTSIGRQFFGGGKLYQAKGWPADKAIIDAIGKGADYDTVTGALSQVGLGDVPAWLRPYRVLSNGEQFRADLARIIVSAPPEIVVDEFTSVVDRQIAQIGAMAFAKAWRRTGGRVVLLSCHYDILPWVQADWVLDTKGTTGRTDDHGPGDPVLDAGGDAAIDRWVRPDKAPVLRVVA